LQFPLLLIAIMQFNVLFVWFSSRADINRNINGQIAETDMSKSKSTRHD